MSSEPLITKENDMLQTIKNGLNRGYKNMIKLLLQDIRFPTFVLLIGVLFMFIGPCLLGSQLNFTNELDEVTPKTLESEEEVTPKTLESEEEVTPETLESEEEVTPETLESEDKLNSEKTYENTSLSNMSPSDFEVLKNFNIQETNKFYSVKEKINDYSKQPTFSPGQFN